MASSRVKTRNQFVSQINFEGLAKTKGGPWNAIHTEQKVTWSADQSGSEKDGQWEVIAWEQTNSQITERDHLMFRDVMQEMIPAEEQSSLMKSAHDQFIVRSFRGEKLELPYPELEPYFSTDSTMFSPVCFCR